ncbi:hypothetical protein GURASL_19650 [Geotalea uraniireducens]|uniref:BioF2-like acetyltransferase domain-containing protein n=1 Tax=Geotalea uraniireducens TaxID=351604 RepID=A0ABN6VU95_9BACT|nr:GNAT family N-acetyltransferase [Geotalea uraniireducens]BDV43042.1 hypothetical protein GURASL_19650 [Geotalea uraniireducens]
MSVLRNDYKVVWFDRWERSIDEALQSLPEMDACPHALYRLLIENSGPCRKRTALVLARDEVLAVVGLRWQWQRWDPIMNWIVPGCPFPVRDGYFFKVLEALGVESKVALWRCESLLEHAEEQQIVRSFHRSPTHKLQLAGPVEEYWKKSGSFYKTVRNIRNRCKDYVLEVNPVGAAEWTIKHWGGKWQLTPDAQFNDLSDRLIVARYLEEEGQYFTIMLLADGEPVAGFSSLVHRNDLVCQYNYRLPEHDKAGVGVYIYDRVAHWAKDAGFAVMDIGGGHDYKDRWAPLDGEKMEIDICPEWDYRLKQASSLLGRIKSKVANLVRSNGE